MTTTEKVKRSTKSACTVRDWAEKHHCPHVLAVAKAALVTADVADYLHIRGISEQAAARYAATAELLAQGAKVQRALAQLGVEAATPFLDVPNVADMFDDYARDLSWLDDSAHYGSAIYHGEGQSIVYLTVDRGNYEWEFVTSSSLW